MLWKDVDQGIKIINGFKFIRELSYHFINSHNSSFLSSVCVDRKTGTKSGR